VSYICYPNNGNGLVYDEILNNLTNASILGYDIEASGYHVGTDIPYGFSITDSPDYGAYASIDDKRFLGLLANENVTKIMYNAKYDRSMLAKAGVTVNNLCDPMIAAHLLEYDKLALHIVAGQVLGVDLQQFKDFDKPVNEITMKEWAEYSCPQIMATVALWKNLEIRLKKLALLGVFWNIEMPFVPVISDMELNGVMVDPDVLSTLGVDFDQKIGVLNGALDEISGTTGMNHNSPDQVSELLYKKLGVKTKSFSGTKTNKRPSVDKRVLELVKDQHQYIGVYLFFKQLKTLKNSYVDSLLKRIVNGRVYGSFNQTRTRTGRLSSTDPNLQKIPQRTAIGRKIRTAFIAPPGHKLMKADFDLLELKMGANCSHDPVMIQAFLDGRDIHEETAIRAFNNAKRRSEGKTLNFKIYYGGGARRDREILEKAYPLTFRWIKLASMKARLDLYAKTLGGRIRTIPELEHDRPSWMIKHGEREAISTIVQGSSAEEVKKGMTRVWKVLGNSVVKCVLQVHDEAVYEVPDSDIDEVAHILRKELYTDEYSVPLTVSVSVGENWGEMKELKEGERWAQISTKT